MDNPDIQKILESMESYPHTGRPRVVEDVRTADVAEALLARLGDRVARLLAVAIGLMESLSVE